MADTLAAAGSTGTAAEEPGIRIHAVGVVGAARDQERRLPLLQRLWRNEAVLKTGVVLLLALLWEGYARYLDNPILFPTLTETVEALVDRVRDGSLPARALASIRTLLLGYVAGVALAGLLTVLAISTRVGTALLETLTAMFNPLPAIALLPLALTWFGLGTGSLVFSVLWAVALNTNSGFRAVSPTLRMVGRNYGLRGLRYVFAILIPAAFPAILTGLKVGWAFAWRTLIAAELVFGAASGKGGLGWFIFENRNLLEIAAVFAGLLTVIAIGLVVENGVFRTIERRTVRRWGMQA